MDFAICLDQFSTNFNVSSLSPNGFSIYTNLDYNNPIASGIPYQDLFAPPIGNCPLIVNIPQGATQILVIDACTTLPTNVAPIFNAGNSANSLITQCCYAILPVPVEPISWCDTSDLEFDVFSSSFVGQIIAGNLTSTLGTVTDYTIGWYKDGDYSAPEFVSGYGNSFIPYQLTHPLAGNTAPYVTAGDWEGIIHDIAINGVTYSSVSGSANGTPIPFESCFGTIVVAPLQCDNGTFPLPYTHQKSFTAAGNGAPPPVIGLTYQLDSSTEYFAYNFRGYSVWDELEIKFISGDPNNTGNPSLYNQPIYLEKARIGSEGFLSNINTLSNINNNVYPKDIKQDQYFKRVLTLTNISRSANPSLPDTLDIKITPNPTNNQTNWDLQMQCLDTFDCTDCIDPFPAAKISGITIDEWCCNQQYVKLIMSGACDGSQTLWDYKMTDFTPPSGPATYVYGYTSGTSDIAAKFPPYGVINDLAFGSPMFTSTTPTNCTIQYNGNINFACSPVTPNSSIGYHKSVTTVNGQSQGIISMSFNNQTDYTFYKDQFILWNGSLTNFVGPITYDPTNINYYNWFVLKIPTTNVPCGDGVMANQYYIHRTAYPNITYIEDPANNYWSITIPMPVITNQFPQTTCSNCYGLIQQFVNYGNSDSQALHNNVSIVNTFGSKFAFPLYIYYTSQGSPTITTQASSYYIFRRDMPIYSFKTLPFVSSSTGWVNLPTLEAVPCPTLVSSSMPYIYNTPINYSSNGAYYTGDELYFVIYFPNLTGSSDWFQLYTNVTSSNGMGISTYPFSVPPPPSLNSHLIYEYTASVGTVHSSSYFVNGSPTVTINDLC